MLSITLNIRNWDALLNLIRFPENYLVTLHVIFNISQKGRTNKIAILKLRNLHISQISGPVATIAVFAWLWLMAGADLLWENSNADWLVAGADLVWENSSVGWLAEKPSEHSKYIVELQVGE